MKIDNFFRMFWSVNFVKRNDLTFQCITFQNGQTHFKNLAANAARFLKYVWPFWDVMQFEG